MMILDSGLLFWATLYPLTFCFEHTKSVAMQLNSYYSSRIVSNMYNCALWQSNAYRLQRMVNLKIVIRDV